MVVEYYFVKSTPFVLIKHGRRRTYRPPFVSFDHFLRKLGQRLAEKPAIIYQDVDRGESMEISYRSLDRGTQNLAASLLGRFGLTTGERLAFALPNVPEAILLNYAAWRSGLVTVPLDTTRDTLERKLYKLKRTGCRLLVIRADPQARKEARQIKKQLRTLKIIKSNDIHDWFWRFAEESNLALPARSLSADCLILFTSGTTASPKGVRLSLMNLFANAQSIAEWLGFQADDRFHVLLPLHHINSTTFVNTTILAGATLVLGSRYSKSRFWEVMAKHGATGASIVPTIAYDLLGEQAGYEQFRKTLRKVRRIQIGSAPVQPKVVEKFLLRYRIPLIQGYGQTETSLRSTGVPMDLSNQQYQEIVRLNALGTELAYTNVTVLTQSGRLAKEGEEGEICVRGPIIMKGYLANPKANREAFAHGWFHSGDTGYWKKLFERKFFFMKGRTKEIIKKGGVLISPMAVENALLAKYRKLLMVFAVGFPDRRFGERIGIVAVTRYPEVVDRIRADVREARIKNLVSFEYPQAFLLVDASQLPRTSTGKIQRLEIKKRFAPLLLEDFRTVAQTSERRFRLIGPEEGFLLRRAVAINNRRWGKHLISTFNEFRQRSENGILIGALARSGQLLGTLSAIRIKKKDLDQIGSSDHWANNWDGVTGNGTLKTHDHTGDSLLCVAISVDGRPPRGEKPMKRQRLTTKTLEAYLRGDQDPVIGFHRKPKAGFKRGASIKTIIPGGRPKDRDAMGYNILMKYPRMTGKPLLTPDASAGSQLLEAALLYAYQANIKDVYVYTRPSALSRHFKS